MKARRSLATEKRVYEKSDPSLLVAGSGFIKIFISDLEMEERIEVAKSTGNDLSSQVMRNFRKPHRTKRQSKKTAEASYCRCSKHKELGEITLTHIHSVKLGVVTRDQYWFITNSCPN